MTVEVAILADDLTGALDAAAPFVRAGRSAVAAINPTALTGWRVDADVIAVSTSTRDEGATAAAGIVTGAAAALRALGPRFFFKKIDSTLRGHVVVETLAALTATGRRRAIVCPAVPGQGRVVRDGRVLVQGRPLADWLPPGEAARRGATGTLREMFLAAGVGQAIAVDCRDAETQGDLAAIADAVRADASSLAVGAAGLAAALAGDRVTAPPVTIEGPVLFVAGSRTRETAEQVGRLAETGSAVRIGIREAGSSDLDEGGWRAVPGNAVLVPDEAAISATATAAEVARWLAVAADRALRIALPRTLVLTGGDTAGAVLGHLGCGLLRILGEVEPGVPISEARYEGRPLRVVTKAGGFGSPDLFARIAQAPLAGSPED
jgi:uncharacterized protein YgbK (DUF1537 family)